MLCNSYLQNFDNALTVICNQIPLEIIQTLIMSTTYSALNSFHKVFDLAYFLIMNWCLSWMGPWLTPYLLNVLEFRHLAYGGNNKNIRRQLPTKRTDWMFTIPYKLLTCVLQCKLSFIDTLYISVTYIVLQSSNRK